MTIRKGIPTDVPQLFELVQELALYEKAPHEVTNTPEQMLKDGFGENPLFGVLVAEVENKIVAMSLYYYRYSTWKGKRLYLEDIIVNEAFRGQGLGKALFDATIETARQTDCTGMMWQVLDWNEPAIQFYKQFNTRFDTGWWNCHLDFDK
ncbi:GNAT family N-acetyltransferase [Larkinella knui]|uniref:GNAT family N-acetyltransferase n=1 Tax=Larkinella knui TaxID=2025310 RepID=A0A3P1CVU2_9BACT|nr:GNAT family N-acetyltransferase [Larkinella knui]RRB17522.1 GNAT family N-acetyltransferase [Larkinella knui]